jgi:phosphoribosyl-AMP cyclohydrolase
MMAWMNAGAVKLTLTTRDVTYWSRSRNEMWRKGATSGHTQKLIDFRIDCDGDTLLLIVEQHGPACHTGERTCFFQSVTDEGVTTLPPERQGPE